MGLEFAAGCVFGVIITYAVISFIEAFFGGHDET